MNASLAMLEKALGIGYLELEALEDGNVERATELSILREEALSRAWQQHGPGISYEYSKKLMELQELQVQLTVKGKELKRQIAMALSNSYKEGRRLAGYRKVVGYAL
ncbi:MAG: hypothetical protein RRY29_09070 [Desulfovibrionaceae bacterium]